MSKKAVIMKGDGIGPEVVDSMINILNECNLQSELIHCDAGSEQWEQNGVASGHLPGDQRDRL